MQSTTYYEGISLYTTSQHRVTDNDSDVELVVDVSIEYTGNLPKGTTCASLIH